MNGAGGRGMANRYLFIAEKQTTARNRRLIACGADTPVSPAERNRNIPYRQIFCKKIDFQYFFLLIYVILVIYLFRKLRFELN